MKAERNRESLLSKDFRGTSYLIQRYKNQLKITFNIPDVPDFFYSFTP